MTKTFLSSAENIYDGNQRRRICMLRGSLLTTTQRCGEGGRFGFQSRGHLEIIAQRGLPVNAHAGPRLLRFVGEKNHVTGAA